MHLSTLALVTPLVLLGGVSAIPISPIGQPYILSQSGPLPSSNAFQQVGQWWNDQMHESQRMWRTVASYVKERKDKFVKGGHNNPGTYLGSVAGPAGAYYLDGQWQKRVDHKDIRTGKRIPTSEDKKTVIPLHHLSVPHDPVIHDIWWE